MASQVVIFAKPGRLRDSLQILLNCSQKIVVAGAVECSADLYSLIERCHPALLILDTNLAFNGVLSTLQDIRQSQAQIPCLILTDTSEQRALLLQAGARQALIKGFSLLELLSAVNQAMGVE